VNSLIQTIGIESWKPFLTALILPPVPMLLVVLMGARLMLARRGLGWLFILLGVTGIWLSTCAGLGRLMEDVLMRVPPPLSAARMGELKAQIKAAPRTEDKSRASTAIVILGSGRESFAPEYGVSNLTWGSLERLRYAAWLSRETGAPMAFSGGVGWAATEGSTEAEVAQRVATQELGRPIRWLEDRSRDTRENARYTIALLKPAGVTHVILVTHGWHMPRALAAFEQAAGPDIRIEAAPMGLAKRDQAAELDWLPSGSGYIKVRTASRELIGKALGF
jgi:uncharacterized SAM-binding protein YcdF (DUF218 family)